MAMQNNMLSYKKKKQTKMDENFHWDVRVIWFDSIKYKQWYVNAKKVVTSIINDKMIIVLWDSMVK